MLNTYLNQTAEYRRLCGTDAHGQPLYSPPDIIPCRRVKAAYAKKDASESVTLSRDVYYTTTAVNAGDTLDGRIIAEVSDMVSFGGGTVGYKCIMK